MRGQEHTIMSYLVWAVFFVAALVVVYSIFGNIEGVTPTPMEQIIEIFTSAADAHRAGIAKHVCLRVYPGGSITLSEDFIRHVTSFADDITFRCLGSGCEVKGDAMVISGRTGQLCVEVNDDGMIVTWR